MKKANDKEKRTFLATIILVLVKAALSIASKSVCSITFCQPSEPNNIEEFLK